MTRLQKLYKWALFLLGVPTCIGCEERLTNPYLPLCPDCLDKYKEVKTANCSLCGRLLHSCSCTNEYLSAHFVKWHFKVFRYENREENAVANSLIYSMKRDNRADVLEFVTEEVAATLSDFVAENKDAIFTNVPRRRTAIVKYGVDQAKDLARSLARYFDCEYSAILVSRSKHAQKEARAKERIGNIIFKYRKRNPKALDGRTVIIVDDVVTTGASIGTAASLIRALGAKKIAAVSIAATYKDTPHPLRVAELERIKS